MRVGGTNRDGDVARCLEELGANAEILHLNDIIRRRNLDSYDGLVFPGGFAYGDYVRAGAIWGKRIQALLKDELDRFSKEGKPIIGICNGFQVLIEAGLLPGLEPLQDFPTITLASNTSSRFECRWVYLKKNPDSKCLFAKTIGEKVRFPVAHGEGRFLVQDSSVMRTLEENNQIVLKYCGTSGELANGIYPSNPNGSTNDVAAICNPSGNVFGLMPHPENAFWGYQLPEWTMQRGFQKYGDGYGIFRSMIEYIENSKSRLLPQSGSLLR